MSAVLVFRPMIIEWLSREFGSQANTSLEFISKCKPTSASSCQSTVESLETHVKKFAQAFAEYLFDRNNTSNMLHPIDLD